MKRRAFTLIELLVVVSIIALLIALLAPGLRRARQQARQTVCLSNLKNMGLAVEMYAQDNNDHFPLNRDHGGLQLGGWIVILEPYAGDKLLYRCPADESSDWFDPSDSAEQQLIDDRQNSYATNVEMSPAVEPPPGSPDPTPKYGYVRRSTLKYASETIYLGEVRDTQGDETAEDHFHSDEWAPGPLGLPTVDPAEEVALGRHLELLENYTYVDGHAERNRFENTFYLDPVDSEVIRNHWSPDFLKIQHGGS